jgi:hypothetical protein
MLSFLKENGYPVSLFIETTDYEEEDFRGYRSVVSDEHNIIIAEFFHSKLFDRNLWADGFFAGKNYIPKMKY